MSVFSNTTPFIALSSIDQLGLLPLLCNQIHVAESVIEECAEGGRILVPDLRSLDWIVPIEDEAADGLPFLFELDRGEKINHSFGKKTRRRQSHHRRATGPQGCRIRWLECHGHIGCVSKGKIKRTDSVIPCRRSSHAPTRHSFQCGFDFAACTTLG